MQISQELGAASYVIRAYDEGKVVVNNTEFKRSLVIMPESLHADWEPQTFEELNERHLEFISDLQPEIVIFGTGRRQRFPSPRMQAFFMGQGIGIEFMNTAAACRTYNILMSEGRNVVCALFIC
jgi:uncharacterized protein